MRKILPVLILTMLACSLRAQYKPILFGMRIGGDISWMKPDADGYSSQGVVPGFTWGFISEFFLMENYALLTGFNVQFIGGKLEYPSLMDIENDTIPVMGTLARKYSLKYIQIPLCLKMQTDLSDKVRIFGKLGIGSAFRLNAHANDNFVYDGGTISESKKHISEEITLMRESLIVGGGVEIILKGSTALSIEVTYDNGFNNILSQGNPAAPKLDPMAYLNFAELGIGILF